MTPRLSKINVTKNKQEHLLLNNSHLPKNIYKNQLQVVIGFIRKFNVKTRESESTHHLPLFCW